jgi:hypothetical protein
MIVNYASSIVNKLEALLTDDARVIIYDHHLFIVQATDLSHIGPGWKCLPETNSLAYYASLSLTQKKSFMSITSLANVIKPFLSH